MSINQLVQEIKIDQEDNEKHEFWLNIYFTKEAIADLTPKKVTKVLSRVKNNFDNNYSVNTKFRFSEITSNPENLLEKLKNYNLNDKEKKEIANYYNSLGNLSKRLNDYRHHFLEEENKPAKGINIVISKEKQSAFCIEQGGASLLNNPYAIIATHNFNVQTTLHEVGHCLGAEDTEIPYTIMTADLDYGSSIIWNSKAKKTIRKNILLEEYIYLKL